MVQFTTFSKIGIKHAVGFIYYGTHVIILSHIIRNMHIFQ